ncbi:asparagine synthase (glutamine-hydrolyzing) [Alkalilimnicola sp. S0819]|uniref:asparagine synthase (glutamine-hydrolyzing) n=1 Tax=Alkalilimnicola sp. S0819 TaxID=2613922 RepID=UPI001261605B|nr:asparagine synthase (glutamine-hydrolyzing) [Alkalilimnicola sp. S0819]KAB7622848.1 asparagine synthase (glutamine-hydrolyzing) [Alkalilimnicola sp. S0819]MPQ17170.1 asparagine synthase (glutamine-hydrolyzing) [Alkalilimnicola sp. S0819]
MCGLAGILAWRAAPPQHSELASMVRMLAHRGPDAIGLHRVGPLALGHARLGIVDKAGGVQPWLDKKSGIALVFAGEIFNYLELREELRRRGEHFEGRSDTEVLLKAYLRHGSDFVQRLNGQFAIALWDPRPRELLLFRDRVGIAPLFYREDQGRLLFASEAKAFLPVQREAPRLNPEVLDQIFTFWAPGGADSLFASVKSVPPGHMLRVRHGRLRLQPYWDWRFPVQGDHEQGDEATLAEQLHALLDDAVRLRLRAEVPLAGYLSGGLDSAAISALARTGGRGLATFSVAFDQAPFDESAEQGFLSAALGTHHHTLRLTPQAIAEGFPALVWHTEQPLLRTAPAPLMQLAAQVRRSGAKVVLSGEGADEVLGGYEIFKEAKIRAYWARQPQSRRRPLLLRTLYPYLPMQSARGYVERFFAQGLDQPDSPLFSHLPRWASTARAKYFYSDALRLTLSQRGSDPLATLLATLPTAMKEWTALARAQYLEARLLLPGYLLSAQGDRLLAAHGLEGRYPYLDHRLIEFAARLAPRHKLRVLREKHLLRLALRAVLPEQALRRGKHAYRAPDAEVLRALLTREPAADLLSPAALRASDLFDPRRVQGLRRKIGTGRPCSASDQAALCGVLTTQLWHHLFVEGHWQSGRQANNFKDDDLRQIEGA